MKAKINIDTSKLPKFSYQDMLKNPGIYIMPECLSDRVVNLGQGIVFYVWEGGSIEPLDTGEHVGGTYLLSKEDITVIID